MYERPIHQIVVQSTAIILTKIQQWSIHEHRLRGPIDVAGTRDLPTGADPTISGASKTELLPLVEITAVLRIGLIYSICIREIYCQDSRVACLKPRVVSGDLLETIATPLCEAVLALILLSSHKRGAIALHL